MVFLPPGLTTILTSTVMDTFSPIFKKIVFCIYLFVFGCAGSSWLCVRSSLVAASGGDSLGAVRRLLPAAASCRARAPGQAGFLAAARGLRSRAFRALDPGSVVVAVSCPVACGIFPDQVSNLNLLHWQADSLPLSHQGSPHFCLFLSVKQNHNTCNL